MTILTCCSFTKQGTDEKELYAAIERAVENGKVRSLGISNYYTQEDFERITENATIMPAVIQNEKPHLLSKYRVPELCKAIRNHY